MESRKLSRRRPGAGRPPQGGIEGNVATLHLRVTAHLRADIERAAKKSGKSLSQECQARLEDSFRDDRVARNKRSAHIRALGTVIMMAAALIEKQTGERFTRDARTARHVIAACEFLARHFGAKDVGQAADSGENIGVVEAGRVIAGLNAWSGMDVDILQAIDPALANVPSEFSVADRLARDLDMKLAPDEIPAGLRVRD